MKFHSYLLRQQPWLLLLLLLQGFPNTKSLSSGEVVLSDAPLPTIYSSSDSQNSVEPGDEEELLHQTTLGPILGLREQSLTFTAPPSAGHDYYAFRGIPYARPPVGELRWEAPEAVGGWSGELNATRFGSPCPQYDSDLREVIGDEDCLFLNIYTPALPGKTENAPVPLLPVFFFIHGGGYYLGSSSAYGPKRLMNYELILVTMNYRLGALGFISTGDETLPGNYGLLDQLEALRWVRDHIIEYGGDSNRITVGGFSAGGASANTLMYSPIAKGMFSGAVMMSGWGNCVWSVQASPLATAQELARELGCPTTPSEALRRCLSTKSPEELTPLAAADRTHYIYWTAAFLPVVDGGLRPDPVLPLPVEDLMALPPPNPVPVLTGFLPQEGLSFAADFVLTSQNPLNASSTYEEYLHYIFQLLYTNKLESRFIVNLYNHVYFTPAASTDPDVLLEDLTLMLTDFFMVGCGNYFAEEYARITSMPVYRYLFSHRDPTTIVWSSSTFDILRTLGFTTPLLDEGVSHGDDMLHLFSFANTSSYFSDRDLEVASLLTSMWASFIATGVPEPGQDSSDVPRWTPLTPERPSFFNISTSPSMNYYTFREKGTKFVMDIVPFLVEQLQEALHRLDGATAPSD